MSSYAPLNQNFENEFVVEKKFLSADIVFHAQVLYNFMNTEDELVESDAIIILGNYDLRTAVHAAELFHRKLAPRIIASGYEAPWAKIYWQKTEAAKFSEVLQEQGVSKENIFEEPFATNTAENILRSFEILKANSFPHKRVILVQKPFTLMRSKLTAQKNYPDVEFLTSAPQHSFQGLPVAPLDFHRVISIIVGDFHRLLVYPEKGFLVQIEIPKNVLESFEYLSQNGFTRELVKE